MTAGQVKKFEVSLAGIALTASLVGGVLGAGVSVWAAGQNYGVSIASLRKSSENALRTAKINSTSINELDMAARSTEDKLDSLKSTQTDQEDRIRAREESAITIAVIREKLNKLDSIESRMERIENILDKRDN